jgi:hypothetical protein
MDSILQVRNGHRPAGDLHGDVKAGSINGEGADAFGTKKDGEDHDWGGYVTFWDLIAAKLNPLAGKMETGVRIASQAGKDNSIDAICV